MHFTRHVIASSRSTWLLLLGLWTYDAYCLDLDGVLALTRENLPRVTKALKEQDAALAEVAAVDEFYDTTLESSVARSKDKTPSNHQGNPQQTNRDSWELSLSKRLPWGMRFYTSYEQHVDDMTYQSPASIAFAPSHNPVHQSRLSVAIEQDLWRNVFGRELELLRLSENTKVIEPKYQAGLLTQLAQHNAERLFWKMWAIENHRAIHKDLVENYRKYVRLMERRLSLGRAEDVDVAAGEADLLKAEGELLSVEVAREQLVVELIAAMYGRPRDLEVKIDLREDQDFGSLTEMLATPAEFFKVVKESRLDLKMLNEKVQGLESRATYFRELGKPSLALFARASSTGLASSVGTSKSEMQKFDDNGRTTIGLKLTWMIGGTGSKQRRLGALSLAQAAESERAAVLGELERDVELSLRRLEGQLRQLKQVRKQISSLEKKRAAERRKVSQARSDRLALIRYDIEILATEIQRISTLNKIKETRASLRLLVHGYPHT